jgi:hypothetical protein
LCYVRNENLLKKYTLVGIVLESDVVVVPVEIGYFYRNKKQQWLCDFVDEANRLKKKVWVYFTVNFRITLN